MTVAKFLAITVSKEDIDNGECGNPHKCALALAIARTLGRNTEDISVGPFEAYDIRARKSYSLSGFPEPYGEVTPDSASIFVNKFDQGALVKPATFTLWEIKDPSLIQESHE